MPNWNEEYWTSLEEQFEKITNKLEDRVNEVADGRITPALADIKIGSGRRMRTSVFFFDIRGFTKRTNSAEIDKLKETLFMLNCLIPMVMKVIYDHNGYIEKNTGDGIMALIGTEDDDEISANNALNCATIIFYVMKNLVNPFLTENSIDEVKARIGIDLGKLLITRIGLPTGTSKYQRNFLTAVGPTANIASKIQNLADTNQIWVGDQIKKHAKEYRQKFFKDVTPDDWTWIYSNSKERYKVWHYGAYRNPPKE